MRGERSRLVTLAAAAVRVGVATAAEVAPVESERAFYDASFPFLPLWQSWLSNHPVLHGGESGEWSRCDLLGPTHAGGLATPVRFDPFTSMFEVRSRASPHTQRALLTPYTFPRCTADVVHRVSAAQVRISTWTVGAVVLIVHDTSSPGCELWLSLEANVVAQTDGRVEWSGLPADRSSPQPPYRRPPFVFDGLALPARVDVQHAQLLGQVVLRAQRHTHTHTVHSPSLPHSVLPSVARCTADSVRLRVWHSSYCRVGCPAACWPSSSSSPPPRRSTRTRRSSPSALLQLPNSTPPPAHPTTTPYLTLAENPHFVYTAR